ncbi:S-layer homology domain-containing protein [Cohnella herbarum]|uniref:SLH domain-containing protein n=1 Tax=Cohnella herbarum TaxID=2728023 RepID=A0A7Z2VK88_9BACL|nr:S-layer homology domain-containing protein [Cohnella herbarum]QJD84776.1 hypothetical protein HH215_17335 [Cohnella herbarum]
MSFYHPFIRKMVFGMLALAVFIPFIPPAISATPTAFADSGTPSGVVMLEDFETDGLSKVRLEKKRVFDGSLTLESNPKYVRNGAHSARLDYDMIGIEDNPSQISIGAVPYTMPIQGYPKKIGMWVYGNNDGHLLTTKFRDSRDSSFTMNHYADENVGIDWTGWRYLEVDIEQGRPAPIVLELFLQMKQSDMSKKNKGSLWVDDIRLIYDPIDEDTSVPVLTPSYPAPNQTINGPLSQIILSADDIGSGIDPNSISFKLDGQSVSSITYDLGSKVIAYSPATPIGGGYHEVIAEARDLAGNPATAEYSFNVEQGTRLAMMAPEEAISNEIYRLQLQAKDVSVAESVYAKLKFDPAILQVTNVSGRPGLVDVQTAIDNVGGYAEFRASGLNGDSETPLANIDFEVSRNAKMERGEAYKQIRMVEGGFGYAGGISTASFAAPQHYRIGFPYKLNIMGTSLLTESLLTVTSHSGVPVEGAEIEFTDANGPQTYVTVIAASSKVYASASASSAELLTVRQGQQLFATIGSTSGYVNVYLPDGTKKGWISVADVQQNNLKQGLGMTDSKGEIRTSLATLAIGVWSVQAVKDGGISERMKWTIVPQFGSDNPEHVQTYVNEDMATMMSVAWQTAPRIQQTQIQYVKDSELPNGDLTLAAGKATSKNANSDLQLLSMTENGAKGEIRFHKALVTGLTPGTKYHYRVGYEGHWSDWNAYKTANSTAYKPVSFVFVTDSHTKEDNGLEIYQKLMGDAFKNYPETQFVMHGGDLVDNGGALNEWNQFWKASSIYGASIPTAMAIGNHDVKSEGKDVFTKGSGLPDNGPETQKKYAYSYDSGDVHFIVLNSEASEENMVKQAEWLREDILKSKKKWKVAMFHRPAYHTEAGRETLVEYTQTYFAPILEGLGVDLVLVGHDHVYAHTYPMKQGKPLKNGERGTVYLDGGAAGWKFYDGIKYDYLDFVYDDDIAVYSAIQIAYDKITIQARTENGDIVDNYAIEKKDTSTVTPPSSGAGPSGAGGETEKEPNPNVRTVSKTEWETAAKEGKLVVGLGSEGGELRLPTNAADVLKSGGLTVTFGSSMIVSFSPSQLRNAAAGLGANELLALEVKVENVSATAELLRKAQQKEKASLSASGTAFLITVSSVNEEGKRQAIGASASGMTFALPSGAGNKLTGLYEMMPDGSAIYVKGTNSAGKREVQLVAGHTYMLLDYKMNYVDLPSTHWAYSEIMQLTAGHTVQGVDNSRFAPNREVNRSEFAAMLVRELGLKASSASGFNDVAGDAWYADAIAAAKEAGLITGSSTNKFNPNAPITRQEMAAMIVRAYEFLRTGSKSSDSSAGSGSFSDMGDAKDWAKNAVAKAKALGLVNGDASGKFRPYDRGTRAESAKLVVRLSEVK